MRRTQAEFRTDNRTLSGLSRPGSVFLRVAALPDRRFAENEVSGRCLDLPDQLLRRPVQEIRVQRTDIMRLQLVMDAQCL